METIIDRTAPAGSVLVSQLAAPANGRKARVYNFDGSGGVRVFEGTLNRAADSAYPRDPRLGWRLSMPDPTGRFPGVSLNLEYMGYARVEVTA